MGGLLIAVDGAKGTGKNTLCKSLARVFPTVQFIKLPTLRVSCNVTNNLLADYLHGGTAWGDCFANMLFAANSWGM
jgi:thymidylate kinase